MSRYSVMSSDTVSGWRICSGSAMCVLLSEEWSRTIEQMKNPPGAARGSRIGSDTPACPRRDPCQKVANCQIQCSLHLADNGATPHRAWPAPVSSRTHQPAFNTRRTAVPDGYRWVEVYPPNWGDHRGQAAKVKGGYSSRMSSRYASTRRSQRRTPTAKS